MLENLEIYTFSEKFLIYGDDVPMTAASSLEEDELSLSRSKDELILTIALSGRLPLATFDGKHGERAQVLELA